ncbi:uncharacterized protein LOC131682657 isoform X2 [Topomyia yanbarensis]|uniref:uncharacterized protein LOC131682657 isoform X2 n=1 Tax=Topomyia yanbarensis TaxID=2498891 RepID=UPI00273C8207|nr:uncharacterized protein LOC131682657 isoform X2 [Topomyia yanbarensis]
MPCMKMCCFRLSTRLGSIQVLVPIIAICVVGGADSLRNVVSRMKGQDEETEQKDIFIWLMDMLKAGSDEIFLALTTFLGIHMLCCILMIIGALKMFRYLLIPFIIMDFIKLCMLTLIHIVTMMVVKQDVSLGDLIALTIIGGFILLLLFYLWACVVALFQIFGIVKTEKYRALFGDDPTASIENPISRVSDSINDFKVSIVHPVSKEVVKSLTYNTGFINDFNKDNRYGYIP